MTYVDIKAIDCFVANAAGTQSSVFFEVASQLVSHFEKTAAPSKCSQCCSLLVVAVVLRSKPWCPKAPCGEMAWWDGMSLVLVHLRCAPQVGDLQVS